MKRCNVRQDGGLKKVNNKMKLNHVKINIGSHSYDILIDKLETLYEKHPNSGKVIHSKCMDYIQSAQTVINTLKKNETKSEQFIFSQRDLILNKIKCNENIPDEIKTYLNSVIHALFSNIVRQIFLIIDLDSYEVLLKSYHFDALNKKWDRILKFGNKNTVIVTAAKLRQLKYERKKKGQRILNMFDDNDDVKPEHNNEDSCFTFDSIIDEIRNTHGNDILGLDKKIIKTMEELGEISEGYLKLINYKYSTDSKEDIMDNLRGEVADLFIMTTLIGVELGINPEDLKKEILTKIDKWKKKIELNKTNIPQNNFKNSVDYVEYENFNKCIYCGETHYNGDFVQNKHWSKRFICGLVLEGYFENNSHIVKQTKDCKK